MIIRQAEPRDLVYIIAMFHDLLQYLRDCGQWLYTDDWERYENGVTAYIVNKMGHDKSLILVSEDGDGTIIGFMMGEILNYAPFFEHQVVGEIQWTWPLRMGTREFARAFEAWAARQGATAGSNYATPGNKSSIKAMEHYGLRLAFHHFFKPYHKE